MRFLALIFSACLLELKPTFSSYRLKLNGLFSPYYKNTKNPPQTRRGVFEKDFLRSDPWLFTWLKFDGNSDGLEVVRRLGIMDSREAIPYEGIINVWWAKGRFADWFTGRPWGVMCSTWGWRVQRGGGVFNVRVMCSARGVNWMKWSSVFSPSGTQLSQEFNYVLELSGYTS